MEWTLNNFSPGECPRQTGASQSMAFWPGYFGDSWGDGQLSPGLCAALSRISSHLSVPTSSPHCFPFSCLPCLCVDVPTPAANSSENCAGPMPSPGRLETESWLDFSTPWKMVSYKAQAFLCGLLSVNTAQKLFLESKDQSIPNVLSSFWPYETAATLWNTDEIKLLIQLPKHRAVPVILDGVVLLVGFDCFG